MNRRQFITLSSAAAIGLPYLHAAAIASDGPLSGHKISAVEGRSVPLLWPRLVGRNAKLGVHGRGPSPAVAILKTDQGAIGWGELGRDLKVLEELRPRLVGKTVAELFDPATGIRSPELKPLDIALHDLAAVVVGQPVWKMLGASSAQPLAIYSGMIYFDDLEPTDAPAGIDQVLKNCASDRALGYRQLKVKIGRGNKWMPPEAGLKRDIEVVQAIAKAFPDCELLVDGNDGFSAETIIRFLEGVDGIPLVWLEEPFVEDEQKWRKVHDWAHAHGRAAMLLADGEQNNNYPLLEKLEAEGILNVRLCDIIGYGFTPWRELMPRLKATKTLASPHAFGSALKTIYAAHLVGGLGNAATIEGIPCVTEHVDFGENVIRAGKLQLSSKPGFGLALRKA